MATTKVSNSSYAPRSSSGNAAYKTADRDGWGYKKKNKPKMGRCALVKLHPPKEDFMDNPEIVLKVHSDYTKHLPPIEERKAMRSLIVQQAKDDVAKAMERIGVIKYYG